MTWRPLEAIPVFLISFVTTALLATPISLLSCGPENVLIALAGEFAFAGTVIWWVTVVKRSPIRALGKPTRPWGDVWIGVLVGLALVVVAGIVLTVAQAVATEILGRRPDEPQQVAECVQGLSLAFLGPIVIAGAPFGEEIFFRGFLFQGFRRRFSLWPAAVVSGVLFGLVHLNPDEPASSVLIIPSLTAVGVGLALLFERRRSLLATISAHAAFNVVGYVAIVLTR